MKGGHWYIMKFHSEILISNILYTDCLFARRGSLKQAEDLLGS